MSQLRNEVSGGARVRAFKVIRQGTVCNGCWGSGWCCARARIHVAQSYLSSQGTEKPLPAWKPIMFPICGHHHGSGAAHDLFAIDRTPITGIETIVTIIPHHEIMPLRDLNRPEVSQRPNSRPGGDSVRLTRKLFGGEQMTFAIIRAHVAQEFIRNRPVPNRLPVEDKDFVSQFDLVAGQADNTFDQALAVKRRIEHHYVPAPRVAPLDDMPGCKRDFEI